MADFWRLLITGFPAVSLNVLLMLQLVCLFLAPRQSASVVQSAVRPYLSRQLVSLTVITRGRELTGSQ